MVTEEIEWHVPRWKISRSSGSTPKLGKFLVASYDRNYVQLTSSHQAVDGGIGLDNGIDDRTTRKDRVQRTSPPIQLSANAINGRAS